MPYDRCFMLDFSFTPNFMDHNLECQLKEAYVSNSTPRREECCHHEVQSGVGCGIMAFESSIQMVYNYEQIKNRWSKFHLDRHISDKIGYLPTFLYNPLLIADFEKPTIQWRKTEEWPTETKPMRSSRLHYSAADFFFPSSFGWEPSFVIIIIVLP